MNFMGLIQRLIKFFSKNKLNPQNKGNHVIQPIPSTPIKGNNLNYMPYLSACTTNAIFDLDAISAEVDDYKAQRDERLKTFKANKAAEEKEREWIKDIIKIAKQDKKDGKKI